MTATIDPTPAALAELAALADTDGPIVMLNLLRFRDQADYGDHDEAPCTGHEAYQRYGVGAVQHVAAVGGSVRYHGTAHASVIAPEGETWDQMILVEYPSVPAFLTMVGDPDYQRYTHHRTAALADSRLIMTRES